MRSKRSVYIRYTTFHDMEERKWAFREKTAGSDLDSFKETQSNRKTCPFVRTPLWIDANWNLCKICSLSYATNTESKQKSEQNENKECAVLRSRHCDWLYDITIIFFELLIVKIHWTSTHTRRYHGLIRILAGKDVYQVLQSILGVILCWGAPWIRKISADHPKKRFLNLFVTNWWMETIFHQLSAGAYRLPECLFIQLRNRPAIIEKRRLAIDYKLNFITSMTWNAYSKRIPMVLTTLPTRRCSKQNPRNKWDTQ